MTRIALAAVIGCVFCLLAPLCMFVGSNAVGALMESRPGAALVDAAREGDRKGVEEALRNGANPNYKLIDIEITPMQSALSKDHYEIALLLAERGAKVQAELDRGRVPRPPADVLRRLLLAEREHAKSHPSRD